MIKREGAATIGFGDMVGVARLFNNGFNMQFFAQTLEMTATSTTIILSIIVIEITSYRHAAPKKSNQPIAKFQVPKYLYHILH